MRKLFWQRWALIFLLVGRLVIGELGHAMPMAHAPDRGSGQHHSVSLQHAAAAAPAGCAEHAGSAGEHSAAHHGGGAAGPSSHASGEPASGQQDCCKSGECECPCLHVPCTALDVLVLNPVATTTLRIPPAAEGLVSQPPTGLFRPPA